MIYQYTRAQAIEDGVLIDVSEIAREAGFILPVALTSAVFDQYVDWDEEDNKRQTYQDIEGRLWDILYMMNIQKNRITGNGLFEFFCVPRNKRSKRQRPISVRLKARVHAGDQAEPVITVMLPNED